MYAREFVYLNNLNKKEFFEKKIDVYKNFV